MEYPHFYQWIDHTKAAQRQHAEIARLTGVGNGRMLEIGSGDGAYLAYFQQHGWECLGIEENEQLAAQAMEQEVLTLQGSPHEVGLPKGSYDLVRIRGLLNTDERPMELLKTAFRSVIPTGYIIAETWNGRGNPINTDTLRNVFDRKSLSQLFQEAGLDIGGIIAPSLGDSVWFPISQNAKELPNFFQLASDKIMGFLDRGSLLVIFAQRPPTH